MEIGGRHQQAANMNKQSQESAKKETETAAAFGKVFNQRSAELKQLQRIAPSEDIKKQYFKEDKDDIEDGEFLNAEDAEDALFDKKMTRLKNTTARHLEAYQRQFLE
jgi:hypothetical protein